MTKDDQFEFARSITGGRRDTQHETNKQIEKREPHGSAMLHQGCTEGESE